MSILRGQERRRQGWSQACNLVALLGDREEGQGGLPGGAAACKGADTAWGTEGEGHGAGQDLGLCSPTEDASCLPCS